MTMRFASGKSHRGFRLVERDGLVCAVVFVVSSSEVSKRTFSAEISFCRAIEYRSFAFLFVLSPLGDSADGKIRLRAACSLAAFARVSAPPHFAFRIWVTAARHPPNNRKHAFPLPCESRSPNGHRPIGSGTS